MLLVYNLTVLRFLSFILVSIVVTVAYTRLPWQPSVHVLGCMFVRNLDIRTLEEFYVLLWVFNTSFCIVLMLAACMQVYPTCHVAN